MPCCACSLRACAHTAAPACKCASPHTTTPPACPRPRPGLRRKSCRRHTAARSAGSRSRTATARCLRRPHWAASACGTWPAAASCCASRCQTWSAAASRLRRCVWCGGREGGLALPVAAASGWAVQPLARHAAAPQTHTHTCTCVHACTCRMARPSSAAGVTARSARLGHRAASCCSPSTTRTTKPSPRWPPPATRAASSLAARRVGCGRRRRRRRLWHIKCLMTCGQPMHTR